MYLSDFKYEFLKRLKPSRSYGRRLGISEYWLRHDPKENCMVVEWCSSYWRRKGNEPLVTMKVYPDNHIWFYPAWTYRDGRTSIMENNLLGRVTGYGFCKEENQYGSGYWFYKGRWYPDARSIPTKDRIVTMGVVKFNDKRELIHYDPAYKRVVHKNKIEKIDRMLKQMSSGLLIRAKLDILKPNTIQMSWYNRLNTSELVKMIENVDENNLKSYQPIVDRATNLYGRKYDTTTQSTVNVSVYEAVEKFLCSARRQLLRHEGAIEYRKA